MATKTTAAPSMPKTEPRMRLSWDKESALKLEGLDHAILGQAVTVTLTGTVRGYAMDDYGNSFEIKVKTVKIAGGAAGADADDDAPSMAEQVKAMGRRTKKGG